MIEIGKKITGSIRELGQKVVNYSKDRLRNIAHKVLQKMKGIKPDMNTLKKVLIGMGIYLAPWALMLIADEINEIVSMGGSRYLEYISN